MKIRSVSDLYSFNHLYVEETIPAIHIEAVPVGFYAIGNHQYYRTWFVTNGLVNTMSESSIVVPVDGIDQMSDEDIVSAVRASVRMSDRLDFEAWVLRNPHHFSIERWRSYTLYEFHATTKELYDLFHKHKGKSQIVSTYWEKTKHLWDGQNPEAGYIYVLSDSLGHYKIGRTKHLTNRIKQLSTQPPFAIKLVAAFQVINAPYFEQKLHEEYAELRLNGEWFSLTDDHIQQILNERAIGGYVTEDSLIENGKVKLLTDGKSDYGF